MKTKLVHRFNENHHEVSLQSTEHSGYITAIITMDWDEEKEQDPPWYSVEVISGYSEDFTEEAKRTRENLPTFESMDEAFRAMINRMWVSQQRIERGVDPLSFHAPDTFKFEEVS